jgi:hypothetical protein
MWKALVGRSQSEVGPGKNARFYLNNNIKQKHKTKRAGGVA